MGLLHDTEYKGRKKSVYKVIITILIIGIPFQLFIYFWILCGMFKTDSEILAIPLKIFPSSLNFNKIIEDLMKFKLWRFLGNTIYYCGSILLVQCTTSALAAFALSKLKLKGSKYLLLFFIATMMMSDNVIVMPLYLTFTDLPFFHVNLIGKPLSLILANSAWGWALFMFKGFFDGIPAEMVEAAKIDGASNLGILARIILPLAKPAFAVVLLNTIMSVYNSFLFPITFLSMEEESFTIMQRIYIYSTAKTLRWNTLYVLLAFATIPILILYIFCQKYITQGISMTGIKG